MSTGTFSRAAGFAASAWVIVLLTSAGHAQKPITRATPQQLLATEWIHAEYSTPTETLDLLNGKKGRPPAEFRIALAGASNGSITFHVFYRPARIQLNDKPWNVRRIDTPQDALNVINSQQAYSSLPNKEFRICGGGTPNKPMMFFVFYREIGKSAPSTGWNFKPADTAEEAYSLLTRKSGSVPLIGDSEVCSVGGKFYVFYRSPIPSESYKAWGWAKRETVDGAVETLNKGTGGGKMILTARVAAVAESQNPIFYIFYE